MPFDPKEILSDYREEFEELGADYDYDIEERQKRPDKAKVTVCVEKSELASCLQSIEELCYSLENMDVVVTLEIMEEKLSASERESKYSMNLDSLMS